MLAITASAAAQFNRMRAKRKKPSAVLRVRVVPDSGCGDFRYAMGIEPGPREGDMAIDAHGITVIVDATSVDLLRGSTLDYSDALIDGGGASAGMVAKLLAGRAALAGGAHEVAIVDARRPRRGMFERAAGTMLTG